MTRAHFGATHGRITFLKFISAILVSVSFGHTKTKENQTNNELQVFNSERTCQNFDRDARPIFLGLKFSQILFFWVGKFFSYFSGFRKISTTFLDLTNFQLFFGSSNFCITHLNPLNEEHAALKNIKSW